MIVQGADLVMAALGSQGRPPRWFGPPLEDGVHLRWAFRPSWRWPANGFAIFRRPHKPGTLVDLTGVSLAAPVLSFPELVRRVVIDLAALTPLPRPGLPRVEGIYQNVPVADANLIDGEPLPRRALTVEVQADAMDSIRVTGSPVVQRVRYVPVSQESDVGWQLLTRLCLPLTSPTYPCHPGPANPDADWQTALARIPNRAGDADVVVTYLGTPPPTVSNVAWTRLHQAMASLFGPPIPAAFSLTPLIAAMDQPTASISPVDLMLFASVDPYVARILGLAWADPSAVAGQLYDYRVVGNWGKDQLKAPEITIDFERDGSGRVLPDTFVRDGIIFRSVNDGTVIDAASPPWNDTARALDLGTVSAAELPGQPAYLRLQLLKPVGEVQLYLRVFNGQPAIVTSAASLTSSWSSLDGTFRILCVAAQSKTDLIDNITVRPAANSGALWVAVCKVGLLPNWSPPISEPLAWISYNVTPAPPVALSAPAGLTASAIATPARELEDGSDASGPRAALRWTIPVADGVLLPRQPVRYVMQRQSLGSGSTPGAVIDGEWRTIMAPRPSAVLPPAAGVPDVPDTVSPSSAAPCFYVDDPAVALHQREADRFYAYRVAGVDLFGRLGAYSAPVVGDITDTDAPPAPINVEAKHLDPADPSLGGDERQWVNAANLPQEGVKLTWGWPAERRHQAPDAREFRIYAQPGRLNAIVGTVTAVIPNADGTFGVVTDQAIAAGQADVFAGEWFLSGGAYFTVLHNTSGTNFALTLAAPSAPPPCLPAVGPFTLSISPPRELAGTIVAVTPHLDGTVTLVSDQTMSLGMNALAGKWLSQDGESVPILSSAGPTLRFTVLGTGGMPPRAPHTGKFAVMNQVVVAGQLTLVPVLASPGNPLYIDYRLPERWDQRLHVEPIADAGTYTVFVKYDLIAPAGAPVACAQLAVSTADDKDYIADNARWNGAPLGGRAGNEGMVSSPVIVQKPLRQQPPRPGAPEVGDGMATEADYYGNSTIDVSWTAPAYMRVQVFRALDETIFATDRAARAARSTTRADYPWLSDDAFGALVTNAPDYGTMSDDLLQALAGLPGNEAAFVLTTKLPQAASPYPAILTGRSANRHCFAVKLVDPASNRSVLGWPSRPVRAPKITAPPSPVITNVLGGDRQITLTWASSRESDLMEYRVFRADSEAAAQDVRTMSLVHTEFVAADPTARPAEVAWVDGPVAGLVVLYYRLTGVDSAGNISAPTPAATAKAFDSTPPPPVPIDSVEWIATPTGALARVRWTGHSGGVVRVYRRPQPGSRWLVVSDWVDGSVGVADDTSAEPYLSQAFRLQARSPAGNVSQPGPIANLSADVG